MLFKQKENEEILSLKKKIESIEKDLYFLKNPCKYTIGENVDLCYIGGIERKAQHLGVFMIVDIKREMTHSLYFGTLYCYQYELFSIINNQRISVSDKVTSFSEPHYYFEKHKDKKKK